MKRILLLAALLLLTITVSSYAAVPHLVRYQGRAVDSQGQPLISPQTITFKIYDAQTAGNLLWSETQSNIQLTDGNFSVLLGQVNLLNLDIFNADTWMAIVINNEELSPRQRITSVPYAYKADTVTELRGTENVFPGSGNVGIGTLNPSTSLEIAGDSYAKLLLHCNGPNGSSNFLDEIGHSVTAYSNAKIDTAQSKFGGASGLFSAATDDYLSVADNDDWYFGTGDFTIDFWIMFNNDLTGEQYIFCQRADANNLWAIYKTALNKIFVEFTVNGIPKGVYYTDTVISAPNTWYHIAIERSGAEAKIFVNGTAATLTTVVPFGNNDLGNFIADLDIGRHSGGFLYFNGWLDEIRISKGIARWTASPFPVPESEYSVGGLNVIGKVGIGTTAPQYKLDVEGTVQAQQYLTGDIIFQKNKDNKLWRMFEEEDGLYLESLKTGKVYKVGLEEINKAQEPK